MFSIKVFASHFALLLLATVMVIGVAFQEKVYIVEESDLQAVSCGWPLTFFVSDQSWRNPPLPWYTNCFAGEWGDRFVIIWFSLIINILAFYLVLALSWTLSRVLITRKSE